MLSEIIGGIRESIGEVINLAGDDVLRRRYSLALVAQNLSIHLRTDMRREIRVGRDVRMLVEGSVHRLWSPIASALPCATTRWYIFLLREGCRIITREHNWIGCC